MFCTDPFRRIEVYENGNVFTCCPPFINDVHIGNIFQTPFEDIWNGEIVKNIRRKLLSNDFSCCSDICPKKNITIPPGTNLTETVTEYPVEVTVSTDNACNVRCKICRDKHFHQPFDKNKLEEEMDNVWLPLFKNAKLIRFGCSGEPFASYKEKLLIKKTAERYPEPKFHFHTNGILGNQELLKELNVFDRIEKITVSIHSSNRHTYNKIVRDGNWNKVLSNLELYSDMKNNDLIKIFEMIFCVYVDNYKDMKNFVKFTQKYKAGAIFWALRQNPLCEVGQNFNKYSIISPEHKHHKNLVKIINDPIFKEQHVLLLPELQNLVK